MVPWIIVLAILGLVLIFAEMLMPGFGLFGILGAGALIVSTVIIARLYGTFVFLIALIALIAIFVLMIVVAKKSGLYNKVILRDRQVAKSVDDTELQDLISREGVTHTTLRPFGVVNFDGLMIDVCSSGEFVDKDRIVKVVKVEGKIVTVNELITV